MSGYLKEAPHSSPYLPDKDLKTQGFTLESCRSMIALMDVSFPPPFPRPMQPLGAKATMRVPNEKEGPLEEAQQGKTLGCNQPLTSALTSGLGFCLRPCPSKNDPEEIGSLGFRADTNFG